MSLQVDHKYATLLSSQLKLFKWEKDYQANFRCPLCGDSQKNKYKKRGYFISFKGSLWFKCHNCHSSMPFQKFLKMKDEQLHKEYLLEAFKWNNDHRWHEKRQHEREQQLEDFFKVKEVAHESLKYLKCISDLDINHKSVYYVQSRKIPKSYWDELYYTDNYVKWVKDHIDDKAFEKVPDSDPRLVIPFFTKDNKRIIAFQGRYLGETPDNTLRYITTTLYDNVDTVFGLNRFDKSKKHYVFEGPIDSMYIDNTLAVAGSALNKLLKTRNKKSVYVYDNEPRNKDIIKQMEKTIKAGKNIVIWPTRIKEKDVGKMIENGYTPVEVTKILDDNTFSGLNATLQLNNWKQI